MAKKVYVTKAQARAAGAIVQRSAASGRYVRPGVAKIAEATRGGRARSAVTGRYVTQAGAARNLEPTVVEAVKGSRE